MSVSSKLITAFFQKDGVPETGLSPTIDIIEITPTTNVSIVDDDPMVEVGLGFYKYNFTSYDETKNFVILADGTATLSGAERFCAAVNDSFEEDITCSIWGADVTLFTATSTFGGVVNLIRKIGTNRTRIDKIAKTLTLFDDDKTTPILVFDLKDSAGVKSVIEVCERDPC